MPDIADAAKADVAWFADQVRSALGENLQNLTAYGPVVTPIYRPKAHRVHLLIVVARRDVDQLLELAKQSKQAGKRGLSPPLVIAADAIGRSVDVFPLEWLDIIQFHHTVAGEPLLDDLQLQSQFVRLQCERELRSLDIQLQRGILASGGKPRRIDRLENEASDSLVRVLRGVGWLSGDRDPLLPDSICVRCEAIVGFDLSGIHEAIRVDGRHDVQTIRKMVDEIAKLSRWTDEFQVRDVQREQA